MSTPLSVTHWLRRLQGGDGDAAAPLWDRFFDRLTRFARRKLGDGPRAAADEEDVAASVLDSFFRRAAQGDFPDLAGRDDLWKLLKTIAARKAVNRIEHERRDKRDHRRRAETPADPDAESPLALLVGREPDPAELSEMADTFRELLALLPDDEMRSIALLRLEGFSNEEIARKIGRAVPTVERRLAVVRECWGNARPS